MKKGRRGSLKTYVILALVAVIIVSLGYFTMQCGEREGLAEGLITDPYDMMRPSVEIYIKVANNLGYNNTPELSQALQALVDKRKDDVLQDLDNARIFYFKESQNPSKTNEDKIRLTQLVSKIISVRSMLEQEATNVNSLTVQQTIEQNVNSQLEQPSLGQAVNSEYNNNVLDSSGNIIPTPFNSISNASISNAARMVFSSLPPMATPMATPMDTSKILPIDINFLIKEANALGYKTTPELSLAKFHRKKEKIYKDLYNAQAFYLKEAQKPGKTDKDKIKYGILVSHIRQVRKNYAP